MIKKVVKVKNLKNSSQEMEDLQYWLSKTPEERVSAVEHLRKQYYGDSERLQRVARVIKRKQS